jgi:hypothetical protein
VDQVKYNVKYHTSTPGEMSVEADSPADARKFMQQYFPGRVVDEMSTTEETWFVVPVNFEVCADGRDTPELRRQVTEYLIDFLQQAREEKYEDVDLPTFYVTGVEEGGEG